MKGRQFVDALRELEERGNVDAIAGLFADNAELTNPHLREPLRGAGGARQFWGEYRDAFKEIRSTFRATVEDGNTTALEWMSEGSLRPDGKPFRYGGVTILEWSGDRISRFATYFDTAPLRVEPVLGAGDAAPGQEDPRSW